VTVRCRPRDCRSPFVFVRDGFLEQALLEAIQRAMVHEAGDAAEILDAHTGALRTTTEIRRAWEVSLPDALEGAVLERLEGVRPDLERWCGQPLEESEALAALRYPSGAYYRTHRDASVQPDPLGLHRRVASIVVFVNSGEGAPGASFAGGALRLHELLEDITAAVDVTPEAGTLIAFPSSLLHEVTTVTSGERFSLVTWMLRPDHAHQ